MGTNAKLDPVNITRIVVSAIVAGVELGINYFSLHFLGTTITPTEFGAMMVQDIAVIPTVAWFVSKIEANASTVTASTAKA